MRLLFMPDNRTISIAINWLKQSKERLFFYLKNRYQQNIEFHVSAPFVLKERYCLIILIES